ncbi:hypothetical protein ACLOJK_010868 [Asimina triloba]
MNLDHPVNKSNVRTAARLESDRVLAARDRFLRQAHLNVHRRRSADHASTCVIRAKVLLAAATGDLLWGFHLYEHSFINTWVSNPQCFFSLEICRTWDLMNSTFS